MSKKVALIHTSFALVESLNALAKEKLPDVGLITIVDDTVLPHARSRGVDAELTERMDAYFRSASEGGADAILSVCSSVGQTVDTAREWSKTPILKIDEPMIEAAVSRGKKIAVLATVESTLGPTSRLLENKAHAAGREIELTQHLCKGAFEALTGGKPEEHDRMVAEAVEECAQTHDLIVLAQASMARVAPLVENRVSVPVLSSPHLAMERLKQLLYGS